METPEQKAASLWKEIRSMTPSQILHAIVDVQIAIRQNAPAGQPVTEAHKGYWQEVKKHV